MLSGCWFQYHHGKHDSRCRGLDDPEQHQTRELHQREDVDLPQRHVAQIDQVGLVLGRHAKQLDSVKELQRKQTQKGSNTIQTHTENKYKRTAKKSCKDKKP